MSGVLIIKTVGQHWVRSVPYFIFDAVYLAKLILYHRWTSACTHLLLLANNYVQDKSIGVSSIFHVLSLFALDLVMCAHTVKNSLLILYSHLLCCVSCLRLRNAICFVIPRARVISRSICFNSTLTLNYKHDC